MEETNKERNKIERERRKNRQKGLVRERQLKANIEIHRMRETDR